MLLAALVVAGIAFVGVASAGIVESRARALRYEGDESPTLAAASQPGAGASALASSSAEPTPSAPGGVQRDRPRPAKGAKVGTLTIPALKRTLPIIEGTDDAQLKKGVGHFVRSVMPGEANNCVLSGHRDTVFTGLGKVGVGDRLIVRTPDGTFTYKVARVRIVHKDDRTVIVPTDHAVLTVTTCYPFNYVGSAPDRFILVADLVARTQAGRSNVRRARAWSTE